MALTGAGLSVESGIPPFRGPGGLWTKYGEPPLDGYQRFLRDPRGAGKSVSRPTRGLGARARRDAAERQAERRSPGARRARNAAACCDALITQNIDDLHRQAGPQQLLEIHGNHRLLRCLDCVARFEPDAIAIDPQQLPPHLPAAAAA